MSNYKFFQKDKTTSGKVEKLNDLQVPQWALPMNNKQNGDWCVEMSGIFEFPNIFTNDVYEINFPIRDFD